MSSNLLTWLSCGLIALVLVITLWLAHAVRPDETGPKLLVAQAPAAAAAASAPTTSR
jgi:hypothetical protein